MCSSTSISSQSIANALLMYNSSIISTTTISIFFYTWSSYVSLSSLSWYTALFIYYHSVLLLLFICYYSSLLQCASSFITFTNIYSVILELWRVMFLNCIDTCSDYFFLTTTMCCICLQYVITQLRQHVCYLLFVICYLFCLSFYLSSLRHTSY